MGKRQKKRKKDQQKPIAPPVAASTEPPQKNSEPAKETHDAAPVMVKKINVPLILATFAIFVVATPVVYFGHAWQVDNNADKIKLRAEAAEEERDYAKARQLYRQYLNFRENDFDTLLHYIRMQDGMATSGPALDRVRLRYEELLRRDPNRPDEAEIRQDIIAVAMRTGKFALAVPHLKTLLEDDKELPELQFQYAQCQHGQGRIKDAVKAYIEALENKSDEPKYYVSLATLFAQRSGSLPHRDKSDPENPEPPPETLAENIRALLPERNDPDYPGLEKADELLEMMIENADSKADAYLARARFRRQTQRLDLARQDVEKARKEFDKEIELNPDVESPDPGFFLFSANLAAEQARLARVYRKRFDFFPFLRLARQDARQGRKLSPQDPRFPQLQAAIEEEAQKGYAFLPATAEKPGNPPQFENYSRQVKWELLEKSERFLREGLDVLGTALDELDHQKPMRTRLRNQEKNPPLNRLQLNQIATHLQWSLADTLITQHEVAAGDPSGKADESDSIAALKSEVNEHIKALLEAGITGPTKALADFLKARLLVAQEDWREAAEALQSTRLRFLGQRSMRRRIDLLLDQCYAKMGNPDRRLELARQALEEEDPNWFEARALLPGLYQSTNRIDQALEAYKEIEALPQAALAIARLHVRKELFKKPEDRRWDEIHQRLDSIPPELLENPADLAILRSEVCMIEANQLAELEKESLSQEKYYDAANVLNTAIDADPNNAELQAHRGLLELRLPYATDERTGDETTEDDTPQKRTAEERITAAAQKIDKAVSELGYELPLMMAAAQLHSLLPTADALQSLADLEGREPEFSRDEQAEFLEGLARAHARVGERASDEKAKEDAARHAVDLRKRAAALQSKEIAPQIELGQLAFREKDTGLLQTAIDRVTKIEGPGGPNGNFLKALQIFVDLKTDDEENIDRARQLLTEAKKERPYWSVIPRTLAELEWRVGNQEIAVKHYGEAFELGVRRREMIMRMVQHYNTNRETERAEELLSKVELENPVLLSEELGRTRSFLAWKLGDFDKAVDRASEYAANSQDFRDHLLEAQLRISRGERGDAVLNPLKEARKLAKGEPEPWLVLVGYYARVGNTEKAEAAIEEAKKELVQDPPRRRLVTLGRCYEMFDKRDQAENYYQEALEAATAESKKAQFAVQLELAKFYSRAQSADPKLREQNRKNAEKYLNELLAKKEDAPKTVRDEARRQKALNLASTGRYADIEEALELLREGRSDEDEVSADDLRTEAKILRVRNRHRDRLALIEVLETLDSRNKLSPDERFLLARTYESTGKWPKAQAEFQTLMDEIRPRAKSDRAKLLADYAIALLNRNDIDEEEMLAEAESLVKQLDRLQPESFQAYTTRALLLYRQDKGKEAADLLEDYLDRLDHRTPEQAFRDLVEQEKIDQALASLENLLDEKNAKLIIDHVKKLVAEDNQEEAVASLKRYISASDMVANLQNTLIRVIARFLEEIEQQDAAENSFRRYAKRSSKPEAILEVAAFLARSGRVDQALDICESAWEDCDPRLVAKVSVGTLRTAGQPTAAQIQRVGTRLAEAVDSASSEQWMQLVTSFADLRDLQGRHQDSIDIYRKILAKSPRNVMALNNLAWLLSYQSQAHDEAQQLIDQAINLYGPIGALLDTRGMISLRRGRTSQALKDLKRAAEEQPQAAIYFHLAQVQLAAGDKQAAEAAFRDAEAKDLDPVKDLHVLEADDYERMKKRFK